MSVRLDDSLQLLLMQQYISVQLILYKKKEILQRVDVLIIVEIGIETVRLNKKKIGNTMIGNTMTPVGYVLFRTARKSIQFYYLRVDYDSKYSDRR